jgi:hypothetical protein
VEKCGMGTKGDVSSTGHVWAARFSSVMARSRMARILQLMNCLFLSKFFSRATVNHGY